jgi:acetolactate synthase-1/2/3 large subunit
LGGGARDAGAGPAALEVAGLIGALVGSTASVKGVVEEDHPRSLECVGRHGNPLGQFLREGDVILAVGTTLAETTTRFDKSLIGPQACIIHVDIDPEEIGRLYAVEIGIVGDARLVLEDLAAALRRRGLAPKNPDMDPQVRALAEAKQRWWGRLEAIERSNDGPLRRLHFQKELRQALPKDTIFVAEGGGTLSYYQYSFPTYTHGHTVGDFSPLGSGYPFALGIKCGSPTRDVVSIHGDGAFMFSMNELATALHWHINTIAIVLHNSVYGNERESQHRRHNGRYVGTDLYIPDLARVAEAFGAYGERVERAGQIGPALDRARRSGRPAVLDVVISSALEELMPPRGIEA